MRKKIALIIIGLILIISAIHAIEPALIKVDERLIVCQGPLGKQFKGHAGVADLSGFVECG